MHPSYVNQSPAYSAAPYSHYPYLLSPPPPPVSSSYFYNQPPPPSSWFPSRPYPDQVEEYDNNEPSNDNHDEYENEPEHYEEEQEKIEEESPQILSPLSPEELDREQQVQVCFISCHIHPPDSFPFHLIHQGFILHVFMLMCMYVCLACVLSSSSPIPPLRGRRARSLTRHEAAAFLRDLERGIQAMERGEAANQRREQAGEPNQPS